MCKCGAKKILCGAEMLKCLTQASWLADVLRREPRAQPNPDSRSSSSTGQLRRRIWSSVWITRRQGKLGAEISRRRDKSAPNLLFKKQINAVRIYKLEHRTRSSSKLKISLKKNLARRKSSINVKITKLKKLTKCENYKMLVEILAQLSVLIWVKLWVNKIKWRLFAIFGHSWCHWTWSERKSESFSRWSEIFSRCRFKTSLWATITKRTQRS